MLFQACRCRSGLDTSTCSSFRTTFQQASGYTRSPCRRTSRHLPNEETYQSMRQQLRPVSGKTYRRQDMSRVRLTVVPELGKQGPVLADGRHVGDRRETRIDLSRDGEL